MNYRLGKSMNMTIDSTIFSVDTRHAPMTGGSAGCCSGMALPMCLVMCPSPMQVFYMQQVIYHMAMARAKTKVIVKPFTPQLLWADGN